MAFFDTEDGLNFANPTSIKRSNLTITSAEIDKLKDLSERAKKVGFDMTVLIADDKLRITFNNELATIETDDYECDSYMDAPTGDQLAEDVDRFDSNYNATDEITKKQRRILETDTPLTSDNVKAIEDEVKNTESSVKALKAIMLGEVKQEAKPSVAELKPVEEAPHGKEIK